MVPKEKRPPVQPPQGKTLGEAFLRSCDRMGKNLACLDPVQKLSYEGLKELAVSFAQIARQLPGSEVGILLPASGESYGVILGLILAGKIPVILNGSQGPHWMELMLEQTQLQAILTTAAFVSHLPQRLSEEVQERLVFLEKLRAESRKSARASTEELVHQFKLDLKTGEETAVILFTSGTEKEPRGIALSHTNLLSNQRALLKRIVFTADDVLLGMLPLFHVYGFSLTGIFPLLIGLQVVYHPSPLDFRRIGQQIEALRVTILATVPTFLAALLQVVSPELLSPLRLCVIGAEKPSAGLVERARATLPHVQLVEGYGLTECSPVLTLKTEGEGVGTFLEGVECLIVDPETFEPLLPGKRGLILVRGPSVFKGYVNASINPFKKVEGQTWFNTQDLGFLDDQQVLHLDGRQSRTVKIGGEMISLPMLEEIILKAFLPKEPTLQLAIIGEDDTKKGAHLVLFVSQPLLLKEVNQTLFQAGASRLLKITEIRVIDVFPMTPLGKIDYKKLKNI